LSYINIYGNDCNTGNRIGERNYIYEIDLAEGHLGALNYLKMILAHTLQPLHKSWHLDSRADQCDSKN